jgi:preprotein translocase subunit SecG
MNNLIAVTNVPGLENSRAAQIGRKLVALAFGLKVLNGPIAAALLLLLGVVSASAQTPTGSFFNGNSSQLGNSLRSVTFFLAAAMIIAGIIFIAYGIITSGLKESLSTWKFITGAACFAFGGVCAAIYAFSQGDTVPLDNQF